MVPISTEDTPERPGSLAREHLGALVLYSAATVGSTWPLVRNLSNSTIGFHNTDQWPYLWAMWWTQQSGFGLNGELFHTGLLFHPNGTNLAHHSLAAAPSFLAWPIGSLCGLGVAYNVSLLGALLLSAYTMFLLARYGVRLAWGGSFLAGLTFSFCTMHFGHIVHLNLFSAQWGPLFLLIWIVVIERGWFRWALVAGPVVLCLVVFSSYYHALYLVPICCLLLLLLPKARLKRGILFGAYCSLWPAVLLWPVIRAYALPDFAPEVSRAVFPLSDYIGPGPLGWLNSTPYYKSFEYWSGHFIGSVVLALCLAYFLRHAVGALRNPWVVGALIFGALALGTPLRVTDHWQTDIPMPYAIIQGVFPTLLAERAALSLALCVAILAGQSASELLGRIRRAHIRAFAWTALAAISLAEHWPADLPFVSLEIPPVYEAVVRDSGGALLEIPSRKCAMYYQTAHHRPLLGGFHRRRPRNWQAALAPSVLLRATFRIDAAGEPREPRSESRIFTDLGITHIILWEGSQPERRAIAKMLPGRWEQIGRAWLFRIRLLQE